MTKSSERRNPEVSVLMSCYNAGSWLREAIDSVLSQTFRDFEFILVNDGSTDETWDIIQSYCTQDERIVAVNKKNTGLADSLNVGIAQAKGVWIARLDADDLCEPTRLEEQVGFVRNQPDVVLLGTGFVEIDERGQDIKRHRYPTENNKLIWRLKRLQGFFPHSSAFYRTDVVKLVGGYNKRIRRAEDWRLWLEFSLRGEIACLPNELVKIRKHDNQISLDNNGRRQVCDATAATVCHFLKKNGFMDPSIAVNEDEWVVFLNWVEKKLEKIGVFVQRNSWADARYKYFSVNNKIKGLFLFGCSLLQSGHLRILLWEKFFGSSVPKRLAQEWSALRGGAGNTLP